MGILRAARPDDAYVGEEFGAAGLASASRTWLVDPLCGTLNFAAQTPLAAVNVALRSGSSIVAAASRRSVHGGDLLDGRPARVRAPC